MSQTQHTEDMYREALLIAILGTLGGSVELTAEDIDSAGVASNQASFTQLYDGRLRVFLEPRTVPQSAGTGAGRDLVVDRALRQAYESLTTAAGLVATSNGERASRVIGAQFDAALMAVETLLELRAGDIARTAARFGVSAPKDQSPADIR